MSDKIDEKIQPVNQTPDPDYWRTFEELHNDPAFVESVNQEFSDGVTDDFSTSDMSSISRRKFLALLGASAAVAGTACTDYRDRGEIIPYNKKPEEIIVGKPNYYASTCTACSNACGILIKTREGRPIKIDGNPDHPVSKGKICAQGQASIMDLYNPDRLKNPKKKLSNRFVEYNWKDADKEIITMLGEVGNQEVALITNKIVSPTFVRVLEDFKTKFPSTKIYSYDQSFQETRNRAWQKCYGSGSFPSVKWNEAKIILSLDGDFLGESDNKIENVRLFSDGRDVMSKNFNRLYVVEGNLSITGMNADYRLRLRPDAQHKFALALANEISIKSGINLGFNTGGYSLKSVSDEYKLNLKTLNSLTNDLIINKGKAFIYAGNHLPESLHVIVNYINDILGNSKLYDLDKAKTEVYSLSSVEDFKELVSKMNNNSVGMIVHLNTNPVYDLPKDLDYESALSNVKNVITITDNDSETSEESNYILPSHHMFESWGDAKTRSGFYSLQQPVIASLYDTRQAEAILLTWVNGSDNSFDEKIYHQYLMNNWQKNIYPVSVSDLPFNQFWYGSLHDGVIYSRESLSNNLSFNYSVLNGLSSVVRSEGLVLQLKESYSLRDGKFANNGWLQEVPHPVSKITWDNYAAVSPATADELGVKDSDLIEIKSGDSVLKIPALVQPGLADNTLVIELGYGRRIAGTVGSNVGFNSGVLLKSSDSLFRFLYTDVQVTKTGNTYNLVAAQTVYAFNEGIKKDLPEKRGIIREGTVNQYLKNPHFLNAHEESSDISVNPPIPYPGLKWGMSIDLNKCIGCSECIVACNVENNIPIAGKDQVDKGREMHWIRIDRYYSGEPEEPKVINQPMLCQHCDQAPCENVCPVVATTHSPDGLNQMIYNRCVGTRYCSNNCPYKVRRFNYFNFRDHFRDGFQENPVFALLANPEVTVRSRGVMEKCTFCIQRISEARSNATMEKREIKGSDVKTACQEACASGAIKFGDIHDENAEFYKFRNHELGYYVLEQLNVIPNITYLAKLRNIHSEEV
jgi:MoCo/4Fe-4S cofactor protein with predicted Tat translocation signal